MLILMLIVLRKEIKDNNLAKIKISSPFIELYKSSLSGGFFLLANQTKMAILKT